MKVQGKGIRASMPFFSRQTEFAKRESDFTNRELAQWGYSCSLSSAHS